LDKRGIILEKKAVIFDESAINRAITRISYEIIEKNKGAEDLCIIGILTRGKYLAERIAQKIEENEKTAVSMGFIDITPFRDDNDKNAPPKGETTIPFDITGKKVVLIDDVIFTGRSIRAAIDGLMSRGRPRKIELAVLIDRGHRELPLRADYVGKNVPTSRNEIVKVSLKEVDKEDSVAILGKVD
jgi:pyrimidine operon attenuation protein/uracil phosphoribosyltransferase